MNKQDIKDIEKICDKVIDEIKEDGMSNPELYFFPKREDKNRFGNYQPVCRRPFFPHEEITLSSEYYNSPTIKMKSLDYIGYELRECKEEYIFILEGFKDYVFDLLDINK